MNWLLRLAVTSIFALSALAQEPDMSCSRVLKYGKYDIWVVRLDNFGGEAYTAPREHILMKACPKVAAIPSPLDAGLLRSQDAHKTELGRLWDAISPLSTMGLSAAGVAAGSHGAAWAAVGIAAIDVIRTVHSAQHVDPSIYFGQLLPATVAVPANGGGEWGIVELRKR
jgi:hypothetical protein